MHYIKKRTQLDSINDNLTIKKWTDKIKTWKESTFTSPSGFHLGHSKALVVPHGLSLDTPKGQ